MASLDFRNALQNTSEIEITVTGRKSGQNISIPVWFAADSEKLYLLPARGSATEWYKNLLKTPTIRLAARGKTFAADARLLTDKVVVGRVIEKFGSRYGARQLNAYYTGLDVAVEIPLA